MMWKVPLKIQSQEIQNWANFLSWFHPIVLKYCRHLRTAGDLTASSVPRGSVNWLKWEISQKQDNNEFQESTKEDVFSKNTGIKTVVSMTSWTVINVLMFYLDALIFAI